MPQSPEPRQDWSCSWCSPCVAEAVRVEASITGPSGAYVGQPVGPASEQRAGVDASEAEAITDRVIHLQWSGLVCDEVDPVAGWIRSAQIESRRCHLIPERQDREDRAKPAGSAEQVSGRRLRSADSNAEIRAEQPFDRFDFPEVADRRGSRVRIEVADITR